MTSTELKEILESEEFRIGLDELSAYLASIMQERPIIHLLAKCLWEKGQKYEFELEDSKCDLTVNGKRLEFKFNYDKMEEVLRRELRTDGPQIADTSTGPQAGQRSKTWGVMDRIRKDVCLKKPDIFVWIICSRDLSNVTPAVLNRICNGREQLKYQETHRYGLDRAFLDLADSLLARLAGRQLPILNATVATARAFPSTYHFKICDFSKAKKDSATDGNAVAIAVTR